MLVRFRMGKEVSLGGCSSIYKYDEGNYIIYIHPLGVPFSLCVSLSSGLFVGSVLKINHKVYHFHRLWRSFPSTLPHDLYIKTNKYT